MHSPPATADTIVRLRDLELAGDPAVFAAQIERDVQSAVVVVPRILRIFPHVASVVEIGCGAGIWLHQFKLHGVRRVLGVDESAAVLPFLQIARSEFREAELTARPLDGPFDLAVSLGAADHLPAAAERSFVASLTQLADVVLFAGGIPGQRLRPPANERWPSYWAALFAAERFACFDVLRSELWYDERVQWQFSQSALVFVRQSRSELVGTIEAAASRARVPADLVHPFCFGMYRSMVDAAGAEPVTAGDATAEDGFAYARLRAENAALAARVTALEQSTTWRASSAVRRLFEPYPQLRRIVRMAIKRLGSAGAG